MNIKQGIEIQDLGNFKGEHQLVILCKSLSHATEKRDELLQKLERAKKYDSIYNIIKSHQNCDCDLKGVMKTLLNNCEYDNEK